MEKKPSKPLAPPAAGGAAPGVQHQDPVVQHQERSGRRPYLTTRHDDVLGPEGRFVDLTPDEAKAAPEGLLAPPTAEQLARRRP